MAAKVDIGDIDQEVITIDASLAPYLLSSNASENLKRNLKQLGVGTLRISRNAVSRYRTLRQSII